MGTISPAAYYLSDNGWIGVGVSECQARHNPHHEYRLPHQHGSGRPVVLHGASVIFDSPCRDGSSSRIFSEQSEVRPMNQTDTDVTSNATDPKDSALVQARRAAILIVDDDPLFRESLARNLVHRNFTVEESKDGNEALRRLQNGNLPDLVLLDWKMPGMHGIEVLDQVRQLGLGVPVLFLTVLTDQTYEEAALQIGAVDFIEKHRAFAILLKRIELVLSGNKAPAAAAWGQPGTGILRVGPLELRFDINRALWRGQRVDLSLTEFHIVSRLATAAGSDIGHRELYDVVKPEGFVAGQG